MPCGRDGRALIGKRHRAVKQMQRHITRQTPRQTRSGAADLALARQKHKASPLGLAKCAQDQIADPILQAAILWQGMVETAGRNRIGATLRAQQRRIAQERRHGGGIQRGRHHHDGKIGAQRLGDLPCQGKPQIGVERAFVEFVEDHAAHAGQIGGILQHPGQDAFGHHLDARVWPHDAFAAHAVAHGLAHGLAHRFCHALGGGARGQAARLEHHDPPLDLAQ